MTDDSLFGADVAAEYGRCRAAACDEEFMDVVHGLLPAGGLVVDVGAGTGLQADAMARRGHRVVAVEPSTAMIAAGRRRFPELGWVCGAGEGVPLRDHVADAVTFMYVLHHVTDPVAVLAEAGRVSRPGAPVVVVSGSPDSPRQRFFEEVFPTLIPDLPDADEIASWGREAGLETRDVRTAVHWLYPHRTLDDEYLEMIERDMFATLRLLNVDEFEDGVDQLRDRLGEPLPAPEVCVVVLAR